MKVMSSRNGNKSSKDLIQDLRDTENAAFQCVVFDSTKVVIIMNAEGQIFNHARPF